MEVGINNQNLSKVSVKNTGYNLFSSIILKIGGLIFTIIIARMLLPELFGVYSLVLSIIAIFMVFTNFGLDDTLLRYLSISIGRRKISQARSYFRFLLRIKVLAVFIVVVMVIILSKLISYKLYQNPLLFYPLIFSCLFLIMESFWNFFSTFFLALKELRIPTILGVFYQIFKISFSLLALMILSDAFKVSGLFIAFFVSGAIVLFITILILFKRDRNLFFGPKVYINKKKVLKFLEFMGVASLSLVFFGSVDTLMLGKFVAFEYLGYYRVALSLVLTIAALFSLSGIFLPIFTQINGKRFSRGFHKTLRYILIISIPATAGMIFIAKYLIKAIYGNEYILGTIPLYFLALLIVTTPLIGLYSIIFQSKEKPQIVSKSVLFSLFINILLNVLVIFLFKNNPLFMMAGVGLATSLSRILLLGLLVFYAKKEFNFKVKGIGLRSPIFATAIMSIFLLAFSHFINMNLFFGVLEIILGAGVYFGVLILTKGINREDFGLIKGIFKRK
ncbi:MAG: oligosaccharide flippase family protein [Candidatus Diapherotrites archaeon]